MVLCLLPVTEIVCGFVHAQDGDPPARRLPVPDAGARVDAEKTIRELLQGITVDHHPDPPR